MKILITQIALPIHMYVNLSVQRYCFGNSIIKSIPNLREILPIIEMEQNFNNNNNHSHALHSHKKLFGTVYNRKSCKLGLFRKIKFLIPNNLFQDHTKASQAMFGPI